MKIRKIEIVDRIEPYRVNRTEWRTKSYVTTEPITLIHFSDRKIKNFAAQNTCFFKKSWIDPTPLKETDGKSGHIVRERWIYELTIPAGTFVEEYGHEEIRVDLEESWDIFLIGKIDEYYIENVNGRSELKKIVKIARKAC